MKLYVFGNKLIEDDSMPFKIMEELQKDIPEIEFLDYDDFQFGASRDVNILDTAKGIEKVMLIKDIEKLKQNKIYSLHDFDIASEIKLMKKIGKIDNVNIFAIPQNITKEKALEELKPLLKASRLLENE